MKTRVALCVILALQAWPAAAAPAAGAADVPAYFASMKSDKIYMRDGPGEDYQIKWVYHRKGLPVEVIGAYDAWRRVRDMDGETGWIHTALLSRERTAVVIGDDLVACRTQRRHRFAILSPRAKPGAVGRLRHCDASPAK